MSDQRALLAAVLAGKSEGGLQPGLIDLAEEEGVLALLEWTLRGSGAISAGFRDELSRRSRAYAASSLLGQATVRQIGRALDCADVRGLLLKGPALAEWLYPENHLRESGDVDFFFASAEMVSSAVSALEPIGVRLLGDTRSTNREVTCGLYRAGRCVLELDLHSAIVNSPLYSESFSFDELWVSGEPVSGCDTLRRLAPFHALLHAAMHRAVDISNGSPDKLKWLFDFHLFSERLSESDWEKAVDIAESRELAGTLLRSLVDAQIAFSTVFPFDVLSRLRAAAENEPLEWQRLGDWRHVQWRALRSIEGLWPKVRWLSHRVLPTRSQMASLYGEQHSLAKLVAIRLKEGLVRILK